MSTRFYVVREISVAAGGVERIPVEGYWLTVLEASGVFSLGFDNSDPQPGIEAGLAIPAGKWGYSQVVIENKSAVELTATLAFNDDGVRDNRLVLAAGGGIAVNNFPTGFDVNNLPATYDDGLTQITRHGYGSLGASFVTGTTPSTAPQTIILPATNTGGVVLRHASVFGVANYTALYADTAAPTNVLDTTKRRLLLGTGVTPFDLRDMYLPAGVGLYAVANGANNYYSATFDIL